MKKISSLILTIVLSLSAAFAQTPGRVYLIGDATAGGWSLDDATLMVTESAGIYEWVGDLSDGELKFVIQHSWMPSYGPSTNGDALTLGTINLTKREQELPDNDNKFIVTAGRYSLHIDLTTATPQLIVEDGTGKEDKGVAVVYPEIIYAVGTATAAGWTIENVIPLSETAFNSGIFKAQLSLKTGELKFLKQPDWGAAYGATVANAPVQGEGEYNIASIDDSNDLKFAVSLSNETTYYVTVNAVTSKMTLSLHDTPTGLNSIKSNVDQTIIYDMQGRMMKAEKSELPTGVYIMHSNAGVQKVIIR